jgi:crotonobetainyl-CoA:carnitine CoA-transferase CaiB-like acyl-CoA transferase
VVSWTLAAEIANSLASGQDLAPDGNRRPGRSPHDCYPCSEPDTWIAVSCFTDRHRSALAECIASTELASRDLTWWQASVSLVDAELAAWTRKRTREQALAELHSVGVPAVPVFDAADRARAARFTQRHVMLWPNGRPVKGLPMLFRGYQVSPNVDVPGLGQHTRTVLRDLCGLSDRAIDELQEGGVISCGSAQDARGTSDDPDQAAGGPAAGG